jgi:hypothetical protein
MSIHVSIYLGARPMLQSTKTYKRPGPDKIPAEMIQAGGKTVLQ